MPNENRTASGMCRKFGDYFRRLISTLLLLLSATVTFYVILKGQTGFSTSVPTPAALAIFLACLTTLGLVEGLQISLVELMREGSNQLGLSKQWKRVLPDDKKVRERNVERFLVGRQVIVVIVVFFLAKLTTVEVDDPWNDFLFPVPFWFYAAFLETGFLTCILVVIVGQLMPQLVSADFPILFLNIRIMYYVYWACVAVEFTGIAHASYVLSDFLTKITGTGKKKMDRNGAADENNVAIHIITPEGDEENDDNTLSRPDNKDKTFYENEELLKKAFMTEEASQESTV